MFGLPPLLSVLGRLGREVPGHRPWPRFIVDRAHWEALLEEMAGADWAVLGVWGERPHTVHLALREEMSGDIGVVSFDAPNGHYPAVSPLRPAAIRLERTLHDLFGLIPDGLEDRRPWLDHGNWNQRAPLSEHPAVPLQRP
ncbi:MAG TPA: NADH-quinone oxidoreductase subunit C, partial [Azospirillaceae bacterium]|nr:NADH-quinone oxidoreductase subunit C [Azospirillaceae bacterium]